jgi:hypothetical protein
MHRRTRFAPTCLAAVAALLLAAPALTAAPRGPSTPEEREKAVALARLLETSPWSDEATSARQWLGTFLNEVPDITVKQCRSLFGSPVERAGVPAAIADQLMFSSTAYLVGHPGEGAGNTPTLLAGLEGALASYEAWRSHGGLDAVPRLDYLLQIRKDGGLESYVRGQARSCT